MENLESLTNDDLQNLIDANIEKVASLSLLLVTEMNENSHGEIVKHDLAWTISDLSRASRQASEILTSRNSVAAHIEASKNAVK
ncbi:hypothetical protein ACOI22_03665 [Glaciecola sp. 2405UD65-10]|uniref:hypothetical protein n=1 Tax=Glaciecola sp. 2405UD65-10 TaxID=3397244 RepID=UPI003B5A3FB8